MVYQGIILFSKTDSNTITNISVYKENYTDPKMYDLTDYGFDFAYSFMNPITPDIGELVAY
jgi:hypothetical protein